MEPTLLCSRMVPGNEEACNNSSSYQCEPEQTPKPEFIQGVQQQTPHEAENNNPHKLSSSGCPDSSPQLQWPSASHGLIDRDEEQQQLVGALKRCCENTSTQEAPEMTIITGKSGSGKTALSQAFQHYVQSHTKGFFVSAKFDQFHQSLPYQVFVTAFTDFVAQVMERRENNEDEASFYHDLSQRMEKAVESDAKLLTDMIPALEQLFVPSSKGGQAGGGGVAVGGVELQTRFQTAFCKFVKAVCSPEYPVVLFIDDVQWSDTESLALIHDICTYAGHNGLMMVVACRGDEVSVDDDLSRMLRELEQECNMTMNEVLISQLKFKAVQAFVAQTLGETEGKCHDLSELAYRSTGGNTFFLKQYLRSLREHGILYKDDQGAWQWEKAARHTSSNKDVVALVLQTVQRFEQPVQEVLKVASCLGAEFEEYLLHDVFDDTVNLPSVFELLKEYELLEEQNGSIRFYHDKIQQACYSLIPQEERPAFHLQLGRTLWNNSSADDLALIVYLVVNQINMGIHLVNDEEERTRLAVLCLRAGERAYQSSAFRPAAQYFELGISLLGRRHWRDDYDISLALFSAKCEVAYVSGEFDKVNDTVEQVFQHARCLQDKLRAHTVYVYALGARNQPEEAITAGMEVLRKMGHPFPAKARVYHVIRQLIRTKLMLRRLNDEDIMNLPKMIDPDTVAAMRMLNILVPYTFSCKPEMFPLLTFRMLQLTLTSGMSVIASQAFAAYGMLCCIAFGNINDGYRYGQLGLNLAHKYGVQEMYPRVYVGVYGMINTWKDPWPQSLEPLLQAHRIGLASGENEFSLLASNLYAGLAVYSGSVPLEGLAKQMACFRNSIIDCSQEHMLALFLPTYQLVLTFLGRGNEPILLTGEPYNQAQALQDAHDTNNKSITTNIHQNHMMVCYYMADNEECLLSAKKRRACGADVETSFGKGVHHFFSALASLVAARHSSKRYYKRIARKDLKQLEILAKFGNDMFTNQISLLKAEFGALNGAKKIEETMGWFLHSAENAVKAQNMLEEALAYERAANFLLEYAVKRDEEAQRYLRKAYSLYKHYGARNVVEKLRNEFECLEGNCEAAN